MDLQDRLTAMAMDEGAAFVGFSNCMAQLPNYLKQYPFAITFGIKLSKAILDEIDGMKPTFTYFNHYRSVNFLIDQIGLKLALYLEKQGCGAYTVAASQTIPDATAPYSGIFPHKTGAIASGLGWIGKNGLFIHKVFGPGVRLGTVLTNAKLADVANDIMASQCGICRLCVEACPANALTGMTWSYGMQREALVDPKACSEYMNKHFKHIGRGSVCGICIAVCPFSAKPADF